MLDRGVCCGQRLAQKTGPPGDTVISQMGTKSPSRTMESPIQKKSGNSKLLTGA